MPRKFGLFLAASLLTFLLFITVISTTAVIVFTPSNVKSWLKNSGVYESLVDTALKENIDLQNEADNENIPIDNPQIRAAAEKAFSPEFLQSSAEAAIDGFDKWLSGETQTPEFSINVAAAKKNFAEGVGNYALNRYKKLPACKVGQMPASTNIFEINCRSPGYDPNPAVQQAVKELRNNKEFLPDNTVTFNTLDNSELKQNVEEIPRWYQRARLMPYILGALSLVAILLIVLLSPTRRQGLKRAMISFYVVAGSLLAYMVLSNLAFRKTADLVTTPDRKGGMQDIAVNILKQVQSSANRSITLFIIGFAAAAVGISIYLYVTRDKPTKDAPRDVQNDSKKSKSSISKEKPQETPPKLVQ